jgi:hypothetical protein
MASKIKRNGRRRHQAKMWRGGVGRKENDGEERKAGIEDGGGESESFKLAGQRKLLAINGEISERTAR